MEDKRIHFGECHHLHTYSITSNQCLKRYFEIFDVRKCESVHLGVCNEWLRLRIGQEKLKPRGWGNVYEDVIRDVVESYLGYKLKGMAWGMDDALDPRVSVQVSKRPNFYHNVRLFEALKLLVLGKNRFNGLEEIFIWSLNSKLCTILLHMKKYAKYKADHNIIKSLTYQIGRNPEWFSDPDKGLERLVKISDLMIKYKIQNNGPSK